METYFQNTDNPEWYHIYKRIHFLIYTAAENEIRNETNLILSLSTLLIKITIVKWKNA